jgi:hypothetical protein
MPLLQLGRPTRNIVRQAKKLSDSSKRGETTENEAKQGANVAKQANYVA